MSDSGTGPRTCASCGAVGEADDLFCSSCGAPAPGEAAGVAAASAPPTTPTIPVGMATAAPAGPLTATAIPVVPPTSTPASAPPDQPQSKKTGLLIVAAAVVALAVVGGVVYFVSSGSSADTPTSVGQATAAAFESGDYAQACNYALPSQRSQCEHTLNSEASSLKGASFRNMSVAKVSQSGNRAVVVLAGQVCKSGRCISLSTGSTSSQSFDTQYNDAVNSNNPPGTEIAALIEQGGKWYLNGGEGSGTSSGNTGNTGNTGKAGSTGSTGTSGNTGLGTSGSTGTSGNTGNT